MNAYVIAGYVVCIGTIGTYASSLIWRERRARRRRAELRALASDPTKSVRGRG